MTRPIAQKYCEGKVKSTLKRGSKELEIVKREGYNVIDCEKEVISNIVCKRYEREG
jgi:hypothetical protein